MVTASSAEDPENGGIRREPELPDHEAIAPEVSRGSREFELPDEEPDIEATRLRAIRRQARLIARQASLDPADDLGM